MKRLINIFTLFVLSCLGAWIIPQKAIAQGASVSFQVFYDELSPYGTWVENPEYGYVWVPNVDRGFTPYGTNGYWVYTDVGWTWVSNYPWGWAPFHYGRWYNDDVYGPIWVPDNEWGPGWVTWRRSEGYYGWAPIAPGISISVAYGIGYHVPNDRWVFVRDRDFGRTNINAYYVDRSRNVTIINNSTVINNVQVDRSRNTTYHGGPDRAEVQQRSGRTITPVAIKESSRPGQKVSNNELQLYRPQVQKNVPAGPKPAPTKVVGSLKDIKTPVQRTTETRQQKGDQVAKQQPLQPKQTNHQTTKQQAMQPRQVDQPVHQQPMQSRQADHSTHQYNNQPQQNNQPVQHQTMQPQRSNQSPQQSPPLQPQRSQPPLHNNQAVRQQQYNQPPHQQPMPPQPANPPQNRQGERPH